MSADGEGGGRRRGEDKVWDWRGWRLASIQKSKEERRVVGSNNFKSISVLCGDA